MSLPSRTEPTRVAILGSTGSIGRQAVDVLERDPGFRVVALAARRGSDVLRGQVERLRPDVVGVTEANGGADLDAPPGTRVIASEDALIELAGRSDVDLVVVGTGGVVSLRPVLAALVA